MTQFGGPAMSQTVRWRFIYVNGKLHRETTKPFILTFTGVLYWDFRLACLTLLSSQLKIIKSSAKIQTDKRVSREWLLLFKFWRNDQEIPIFSWRYLDTTLFFLLLSTRSYLYNTYYQCWFMEIRYGLRFEFQLPSSNIGKYVVKLIQGFWCQLNSRPSSANLH